MPTLEIKNLTKSFGDKKAVNDISFSANEGMIFGLVGRNGAGKTTTIRMLMNIYWPDSGQILYRGVERGPDFGPNSSYLPEERGLYKNMSVIDNLMFLAEIRDVDRKVADERAKRLLDRFELLAGVHIPVERLSKGNQQKVQIIGAIMHDPKLLVLDEPFSGLDPVNTELLKDLIVELKNQGKLIILCTHQMDIAEKLCDHICLVHEGELVLNASMADIKRQYSQSKVSFEATGDLSFLESLPYVHSVTLFGGRATVQVNTDKDIQLLLQELVKRDVHLRKFDANDMSLHDIFVQLTRGSAKGAETDTAEAKKEGAAAEQRNKQKESEAAA